MRGRSFVVLPQGGHSGVSGDLLKLQLVSLAAGRGMLRAEEGSVREVTASLNVWSPPEGEGPKQLPCQIGKEAAYSSIGILKTKQS